MNMFWVLWCWALNICPHCEQTFMVDGRHWPVSKCVNKNDLNAWNRRGPQ